MTTIFPGIGDVGRIERALRVMAPELASQSVFKPVKDAFAHTLHDGLAGVTQLTDMLTRQGTKADAAGLLRLAAAREAIEGAARIVDQAPAMKRLGQKYARFDLTAAAPLLREGSDNLRAAQELADLSFERRAALVQRAPGGTDVLVEVPPAPRDNRYVKMKVDRVQDVATRILGRGALPVRVTTHGVENVPKRGGVLLAPTHGSNWDGIIYGTAASGRRVHFMVTANIWKEKPWLGALIERAGGFPVQYGDSGEAMAISRRLLREGEAVMMFPEGRMVHVPGRTRAVDYVGEPHTGIARLAISEGVPVVPMGAAGARKEFVHGRPIPRQLPVDAVAGKPISFAPIVTTKANLATVRERIWQEVGKAQDEAQRIRALRSRDAVAQPEPSAIGAPWGVAAGAFAADLVTGAH